MDKNNPNNEIDSKNQITKADSDSLVKKDSKVLDKSEIIH